MNLVPYASKWYKLFSIWVFVAIAVLSTLQGNWELVSQVVPNTWYNPLMSVLSVLGIIARLVGQPQVTTTVNSGE